MKTKILAALLLLSSTVVFAEDTPFIQVQKNKKDVPVSLQTATVTYEKAVGRETVSVDLVGVIHIADSGYYSQLNDDLSSYDCVLYELVAEKGTIIKKGEEKEPSILHTIQKMAGQFLGLEHQISTEPGEGIDYEQDNFVHADMSPDDLQKEMAKNGDDQITMVLSTVLESMRKRNKEMYEGKIQQTQSVENIDLMSVLNDPDGPLKIKRLMAQQFGNMKGDELGEVMTGYLVDKRNAVAMKVFDEEVEKGKKQLAIFYGAAHMPDFEKRLLERGYKKTHIKWNTAWDLRESKGNQMDIFKLLENFTNQ